MLQLQSEDPVRLNFLALKCVCTPRFWCIFLAQLGRQADLEENLVLCFLTFIGEGEDGKSAVTSDVVQNPLFVYLSFQTEHSRAGAASRLQKTLGRPSLRFFRFLGDYLFNSVCHL